MHIIYKLFYKLLTLKSPGLICACKIFLVILSAEGLICRGGGLYVDLFLLFSSESGKICIRMNAIRPYTLLIVSASWVGIGEFGEEGPVCVQAI